MCRHLVLFYEDVYPAEKVSDFFADGLLAGDSCLTLLTTPHRLAVERCLQARGIRTVAPGYAAVDTDAALAQMSVDGRLDMQRAHDLLTPWMIAPPGAGAQRVRAAGDLAPTLCAAGRMDDAVAFEALVHRLARAHEAAVICAYPVQSRGGVEAMGSMLRLSAEHDAIEFPERLWVQSLLPSARPGLLSAHG